MMNVDNTHPVDLVKALGGQAYIAGRFGTHQTVISRWCTTGFIHEKWWDGLIYLAGERNLRVSFATLGAINARAVRNNGQMRSVMVEMAPPDPCEAAQ